MVDIEQIIIKDFLKGEKKDDLDDNIIGNIILKYVMAQQAQIRF